MSRRHIVLAFGGGMAAGAGLVLLGPKHTRLRAHLPVISVTAIRTGAGKSPIAQALALHLRATGRRVGVLRPPLPYRDLNRQSVQRFATLEDLDRHDCTIEEREEYAPWVERGLTIFAGVDYAAILDAAEAESDVILWAGGNNDRPFLCSDLSIVVADALRPGHELSQYPGELGFRGADILVINKVVGASPAAIADIREDARALCPGARIVLGDLLVELDHPELVLEKRVLVVEDGPTVTHGGMAYGAGTVAAMRYNAKELVDPRPHAVGSIAEAYCAYPHMRRVLPALGYSEAQRRELRETIVLADPEVVVDASPANLTRLFDLDIPVARVHYVFSQVDGPDLFGLVDEHLSTQES